MPDFDRKYKSNHIINDLTYFITFEKDYLIRVRLGTYWVKIFHVILKNKCERIDTLMEKMDQCGLWTCPAQRIWISSRVFRTTTGSWSVTMG